MERNMKVNELTGAALDWAVAKCEGYFDEQPEYWVTAAGAKHFLDMHEAKVHWTYPSTDWAEGGPIIEREGIGVLFDGGSACSKPSWFATPDDQSTQSSYEGEQFDPSFMVDESAGVRGPTPLIAAMRCYVASKLGDEIEIPEELL